MRLEIDTFVTAVNTPRPIPTPSPGAAKKARPEPRVPSNVPPITVTKAPAAAYFAYRINRLTTYRRTYLEYISYLRCRRKGVSSSLSDSLMQKDVPGGS